MTKAPHPSDAILFNSPNELSPKIEYWTLKILLDLGGHREFIHKEYFSDDQIANALGLEKWINRKEALDRAEIIAVLRKKLKLLESDLSFMTQDYNAYLTQNIKNLQTLINLSEIEATLLEFMLIVYNEPIFNSAMDLLGDLSTDQCYRVSSFLLQLPESEVRSAFSSEKPLARTGLVRMNHGISMLFRNKIDLLSRNFIEAMFSHETTPYNILKDVVSRGKSSLLTLDNYQYLKTELAILLPYLSYALQNKKVGVNILIYGEPGTGKTEFARVLSEHFKVSAYEVVSETGYGETIEKGEQRLYAYLAAQNFFCNQNAMIIFDEIEDIFEENYTNQSSNFSKAWINHILETNLIPTLWICNEIYDIEPSTMRRFDFVLNLKAPPKAERKAMIQHAIDSDLQPTILNELSKSEHLVPAIINRVASVINPIKDQLECSIDDAAVTLVNNTLKAQGNNEIKVKKIGGLSEIYNPAFTNADNNLAFLAERLKVYQEAKICLYGPSGTGKSAYAHWLSDYLNKPLLIKKVSDLMDKYVGETEKQIASAFNEANTNNAILLLDEVDSFLRDRRFAQQGYEVTMVNEMLTQMEEFSGIFIATTNLMEQIDQAMLRRFDFKVKFDFLTSDQAFLLFTEQCKYLGFDADNDKYTDKLKRFNRLTPGDFAVIARQAKLGMITTTDEIIAQLEKENKLKQNHKVRIGFNKS